MPLTINDCVLCGEEPGVGTGSGELEDGASYEMVMIYCGSDEDEDEHPFVQVSGQDPRQVIGTWNALHPIPHIQVYEGGEN